MIITIIEGSELAETLARILQLFEHKVNVIRHLEQADINSLSQPCISQADVVITLMESDADNLVACLFIKKNYGTVKTISRVNNPKYIDKYEKLGIDIAFDGTSLLSVFIGETLD